MNGLGRSRNLKSGDQFPKNIDAVRIRDMAVPKRIDIDLAIALTDFEYGISGNVFYLWDAPDDTYIDIRINSMQEQRIPFVEQTGLRTPFDRLYITTPAGQAGTVTILYGTEAPELMEIIDNRSALMANVDAIRDELRGDITPEPSPWLGNELTVGNAASVLIIAANVDRKACTIQAKAANAGLVYIGFDNTVLPTKWIAELQAGMAYSVDDYRGDLYARASALGQLVGYGEW